MLITPIDDYYEASYITGPTHTTLQIALLPLTDVATASIAALSPRGDCSHGVLDPDAILSAVQAGVAQANRVLHASYQVRRIGYVLNDTPKYVLYHVLAYRIALHHHSFNLPTQTQATERKAFEIIVGKNADEDVWLLEGRAWLDISLGDVLFAVEDNGIESYEVVRLVTYGHDVETLSRMMTGAIYVRANSSGSRAPTLFLYR